MDMKEKLVEILRKTRYEYRRYIAMKDCEKRMAKTDEEFLAVDDSIMGEIPFCADFLIANGVTVQPVKVGDYVYYIKGGYYKEPKYCEVSRPCEVVEVTSKLKRDSGTVMHGFITDKGTRYSFNGIGKTVFLSHEEAVNALEKRINAMPQPPKGE